MKKVYLSLFALLLSTGLFAQVEFGVKAGLNFNSASVDVANSGGNVNDVADTRTGYHFGAYGVIKLGPIALQPEAYYSVQGANITVGTAEAAINSSYLQIPILVRLNFLKILNIHAGPQYGFLFKNELDQDGAVQDLKDQSASGDFSVVVGVGLDLPFGLRVTGRYVKGFTDMIEDTATSGTSYSIDSFQNAMFQISIGYALIGG
ncbi:MAG: PorT family protein [Reichenbachiella sp.]